jgi:hypothetical protein
MECAQAVEWLTDQISRAGMSVVRTFDLQAARRLQTDCPCLHHGTHQRDCQMVVLLIYQDTHPPITLIAHAYDGQTWFSVVDTPQQRADPDLEAAIRDSLHPPIPLAMNNERLPHSESS